jgi:hypothetical protein
MAEKNDLRADVALARAALGRLDAHLALGDCAEPGSDERASLNARAAKEAVVARALLSAVIDSLDDEEEE